MSTSTTMAMLCINIGVFLSPIVLPIMADGIGDGSAQLIMVISCVGFAALGAIMSVVAVTSECKVPAAEPETIDAVAAAIATERERECVACS